MRNLTDAPLGTFSHMQHENLHIPMKTPNFALPQKKMKASFTLLNHHQRIKGHRVPKSFTPKEESGSHYLLNLD